MDLAGKRIGFGLTGSHCTYTQVIPEIKKLVEKGADVIPIVTDSVKNTTTRFGKGEQIVAEIEQITKNKIIDTVVGAEPFGPKDKLDCLIIAPMTGNSLSKLASSHIDSPVLMAAKATLRNLHPVVIGISTNDGLGLNGVNIMKLVGTKNIYFVPFGQDAPFNKPNSLVAKMDLIIETTKFALKHEQIQPVIIGTF